MRTAALALGALLAVSALSTTQTAEAGHPNRHCPPRGAFYGHGYGAPVYQARPIYTSGFRGGNVAIVPGGAFGPRFGTGWGYGNVPGIYRGGYGGFNRGFGPGFGPGFGSGFGPGFGGFGPGVGIRIGGF